MRWWGIHESSSIFKHATSTCNYKFHMKFIITWARSMFENGADVIELEMYTWEIIDLLQESKDVVNRSWLKRYTCTSFIMMNVTFKVHMVIHSISCSIGDWVAQPPTHCPTLIAVPDSNPSGGKIFISLTLFRSSHPFHDAIVSMTENCWKGRKIQFNRPIHLYMPVLDSIFHVLWEINKMP